MSPMSKQLPTLLITPIALAAVAMSLSGCGGSSTSTTASSASPAATTSAPADAATGSLAASCSKIDAVMAADPDSDPAGTAAKLADIQAEVTTPDADLIGALADAYGAIADNPNVVASSPEGEAMISALSDASKAMGAACQTATMAPGP